MTIDQAYLSAITGLSSATVALFALQIRYIKRLEVENDECHKERLQLATRLARLEGHIIGKKQFTDSDQPPPQH